MQESTQELSYGYSSFNFLRELYGNNTPFDGNSAIILQRCCQPIVVPIDSATSTYANGTSLTVLSPLVPLDNQREK